MIERVFLGWDQPFLTRSVAWLLERRDELPGMTVVVPTAQSGRRLREALAEAAGALLAPKVVTPGSFLQARDAEAAAVWIERVAWVEVLENVADWSAYAALFPEAPDPATDWAGGLALEMVRLRQTLQENGLLLTTAARKLQQTVEAERWEALGGLEDLVERKLSEWNLISRSRMLAEGVKIPPGIARIVLAGVTDMPPLVERALLAWDGPVAVLIGAPEGEAEGFSPLGRPLANWAERPLPNPEGSLTVVADPRQQAAEALRAIAEKQTVSNDIALGSADTEVGDELARAFTHAGWTAFHPAAAPVTGGLFRWFGIWRAWLSEPTPATLADLLSLPETGVLVAGKRAQKAKRLAELRDEWMVVRTEDLQRRCAGGNFRNDSDKESAGELCQAAVALEGWRASFLSGDFGATLARMLEILARTGPATAASSNILAEWLTTAAPVISRVKRGPGFWLELMLAAVPSPTPLPPAGRVLDVQGWLELFHEPGRHLVLCGMNEGKVPARSGGEPWLSEASRAMLGLIQDADRAARDAFLYQSMLECRRVGGRVDVICGKSGTGGEPLLPSRLLLASTREELPARVKSLFKDIEPPDAGLRWHADWQWTPAILDPPQSLGVTSLRDYLACPFRYYLKNVVKMQGMEPGRMEWNRRDFGTVTHEVLERWGRDTEARECDDAAAIHAWLCAELKRVVAEWFGQRVPLAIRIQAEAIQQRLLWLAQVQAGIRADGWQVVDVERSVKLTMADGRILSGKIDRIDRHRDTGQLRVLDYKTGKVDSAERAHRKKITANSELPGHLTHDCPAIYGGEEKGKPVDFLWHNLQLPLYAAALVSRGEVLPTPCYFTISTTAAEVKLTEWTDFEMADLEAATACAVWVASQIAAKVFWPPAEKVTYDDYAVLAAGRNFEAAFQF